MVIFSFIIYCSNVYISFGFHVSKYKINRPSSEHRCLLNEFGTGIATGAKSLRMLNCLFLQNPGALKPICFTCLCHLESLAYSSKIHISSTCSCQHVMTVRFFWALKAVKELVSCKKMTRTKYNIGWLTPGAPPFTAYLVSHPTKISYWDVWKSYC